MKKKEKLKDMVAFRNGVRVEIDTGGNVVVYTDGHVNVRPAVNDDAKPKPTAVPGIGDTMPDGTIFAGLSPNTNQPMYTTPEDAPLTMKWKQAMAYADELVANGHSDWRVPTKGELNVLFQNRAAIGGFNQSGPFPAGYYWSSSEFHNYNARSQNFSDGLQEDYGTLNDMSVRCVRR